MKVNVEPSHGRKKFLEIVLKFPEFYHDCAALMLQLKFQRALLLQPTDYAWQSQE